MMPLVACRPLQHSWVERIYPGLVLELSSLDLGEIADALADQTDYEHRWLINPQTGEVVFWTADTGIDGQTPVDLDDLDLVCIDPLPSWVWYQDMADFAEAITDDRALNSHSTRMDRHAATRRLRHLAETAGIHATRAHPHMLRHILSA